MPRFWKLTVIRPVAIMPVTKYWVNLTPPPISPLKIDAEDQDHDDREAHREDDGLPAAQELA